MAGARREKSSLEHLQYIPKQLVIFYGPGIYIPTKARKLVALDSFFRVVGSILPTDPALVSANLWHNDLHAENIFVDPAEPTKVLGIIDWQSVSIEPLFSHLLEPSFLNYGGPEIEDDLQRPAFPDTKSLSKEEKAAAFELYLDQCLMIAWRMLVHKKNPAQYAAIKFRETNIASILFLSQNIFSLGEAHFRAVLLALQDEWAELHPNTAFPITFSDEEVAEIQRDIESAERGIRIMQTIREQLGDLWPERGIIEHEYYDVVMEKLASIKRDLMAKYVKSEVERREFEHFWPFEC